MGAFSFSTPSSTSSYVIIHSIAHVQLHKCPRDKKMFIFHRALRFEDLAMQPMKKALEIVDFLDFPTIRNNLETYIDRHSRARKPNNLTASTVRNSSSVPFKWIHRLQPALRKNIEIKCKTAMELWGYLPSPMEHPESRLWDTNWPIKSMIGS